MESKKISPLVLMTLLVGILAGAGSYYVYRNHDLAMPPVVSAATANSHYKADRNDIAWSVPKPAAEKSGVSQ